MSSEDPWHDLGAPKTAATVNARRIDDSNRWDFYWGRDTDGCCLLILRHGIGSSTPERLPRLKEIDVFVHPATSKERASLILRLLDANSRDIFHRLCLDIVAAASRAPTEAEALAITLARTWRWHHLLRGGSSELLSVDEQKGLIGELLVMEGYVLPSLGAGNALAAWRGPLGGAKDFVVGRMAIESKVRTTEGAQVFVSSEFQLDDADLSNLFLHVSVLDPASLTEHGGFTITESALRVRQRFLQTDEQLTAKFDALLTAAGFLYEDDYAHYRWASGGHSIYRVTGAFPRLIPTTLPNGITKVKYTLSLSECVNCLATPSDLETALVGSRRAF